MRYLLLLIIILSTLAIVPNRLEKSEIEQVEIEKEEIILLFVGDIMLNRGVEYYIKRNNDWRWPFLQVADFLNEADVVFGNLESVISDKGHNVGSIYSFRADPKSMEGLIYSGFNIVSVANNHSFDYTGKAFSDSLSRLKEAEILYTGGGYSKDEAYSPTIKELKGTKIGFLGYTSVGSPSWEATSNSPGIAWIDIHRIDKLRNEVASAKNKVDFLIVSFHFGEEYQKKPSNKQVTMAEAAIDSGANLIIGHHPHVLQPLVEYKDGWIAYSLGNFIFDQYFSEETTSAAILKVVIKGKTIKSVEMIPTKINNSYQVTILGQ